MSPIGPYSKDKIYSSLAEWGVTGDYQHPIFLYLVQGFEPGSFFTALFANDAIDMLCRSHPANTITSLSSIAKWIRHSMPDEAYGSYVAVDNWIKLSDTNRVAILVRDGLIFDGKTETMMALKGVDIKYNSSVAY